MNAAVALLWRSRLRRQWRAWAALALLLGVGTGAGLACLAGARRTASSFSRVADAAGLPDVTYSHGLPEAEAMSIAAGFRGVSSYVNVVGFTGYVEGLDRTLLKYFAGSAGSDYAIAAPVLRRGRYPDPARADEVLLTGRAVGASGIRLGDQLSLRLFKSDFSEMVTRHVTVVGTAIDLDVVADRSQDRSSVRFTPAFTEANAEELQAWSATGFVLAPSASLERDLLPQLQAVGWSVDETRAAAHSRVQGAVRPLGTTLGLVGGLLVLATVVVVGQALARRSDASQSETRAANAMGMTGGQIRLLDMATLLSVSLPGVITALAVAVALSPLFPLGSTRPLEPARGLDADLTVLGLGAAAVLLLVFAGARLVAGRSRRPLRPAPVFRASRAVAGRPAATAGLSLAIGATAGARRRYWGTIWGLATALSLVVAAIAFVSALDRLHDDPVRYGVGWDLTARNAYGDVPPEELRALFEDDGDIRGVAGAGVTSVTVNGVNASALAVLPITGELWPTLVNGRLPGKDDEILVGRAVLRALGAEIGDTVELASPYFASPGAPARIVGIAVFPSIDIAGFDPTRLADGVAMTWGRYQSFQTGLSAGDDEDLMPDITFLDLADGVAPATIIDRYRAGLPELSGVAPTEWLTSLAPLEVIETHRAGGLIWLFVGLLGVTVAATVGHSLGAAAHQRRRDYAVLKVLGFTRRQVAGTVLGQSLAVVAPALAIALPVGVALGRTSWRAFAQMIGVIDTPVAPFLAIVTVTVGALALAAVIALVPAFLSARVTPAAALRQE